MPIHQQLWSLKCCRRNRCVTLARCVLHEDGSHCSDKVDDIQAVRKSSTDQCNTSSQLLFPVDQWKRSYFFHFKKLRRLPSAFSRIVISSGTAVLLKFHFLISWFYECTFFIQYFSVTSWVTSLRHEWRRWWTSKYSADSSGLLQVSFLRPKNLVGLRFLWSTRYMHCVSKNAPTLASCNFDKHGLILIIFAKQYQQN